jgi:hypothetical protein
VGSLIGRSPHLIKGGGLDPLQVGCRVNLADLANKSLKKLGTLIDSVNAWTVYATTEDSPDRGQSGLRTVRPQGRIVREVSFLAQ